MAASQFFDARATKNNPVRDIYRKRFDFGEPLHGSTPTVFHSIYIGWNFLQKTPKLQLTYYSLHDIYLKS